MLHNIPEEQISELYHFVVASFKGIGKILRLTIAPVPFPISLLKDMKLIYDINVIKDYIGQTSDETEQLKQYEKTWETQIQCVQIQPGY